MMLGFAALDHKHCFEKFQYMAPAANGG